MQMQSVHTAHKENEDAARRQNMVFLCKKQFRGLKYFAFIFDFMHNIYQKQSYSLLNETLFNTGAVAAGSTQSKFTDLHRLSAEQIIFFMSLVKDPFITVKFSQ